MGCVGKRKTASMTRSDWAASPVTRLRAGHSDGKQPPKTVLACGVWLFYQRFTVPNSFGSNAGTPYVIQAFIRWNQSDSNHHYQSDLPRQPVAVANATLKQTLYSVDPHFHAARTYRRQWGSIGSWPKKSLANVTYLYGRGVTNIHLTTLDS